MAEPGTGLLTPVDYDPFESAPSATMPQTFQQPDQAPLQVTVRPEQQREPIAGVSPPPSPYFTPNQVQDWSGPITQSFNPETIRDQPPPPQVPPPLPGPREVSTVTSPLAANQRIQAELENPYIMDRLIAYTQAEAGNLGTEGKHKFLETIRNAALSSGRSIAQILADPTYFPRVTHMRARAPVDDTTRAEYEPLIAQSLSGSNTANFATGNASWDPKRQRFVGFAGGPVTSTTGSGRAAEHWGIESKDLPWARSVGYEGGEAAPYVDTEDPFARAAQRQRTAVRPEAGRQEGLATRLLENFLPGAAKLEQANQIARPQLLLKALQEMIGRPQAAIETAGSLQRGGSYDPAPAFSTASGMFAGRVPSLAVGRGVGEAGVFGGRLSMKADHAALIKAEDMAAAGVPMEQIHQETGWFQSPADKQWRYEINDQNARKVEGVRSSSDMSKVLEHPELYEAYPHLKGTGISMGGGPNRGSYMEGAPGRAPYINASGETPRRQLGTALHEVQHAVQDYEGFSPGSSPETAGSKAHLVTNTIMDNLEKRIAELPPGPERKALEDRYGRMSRLKGTIDEYDLYHRHAGETEARNVSWRQPLSAEERAAYPPWKSEDVLPADQITGIPGKGVAHYEPKPGEAGDQGYHTLEDTFAGTGSGAGRGQSGRTAGVAEAQRAAADAAGSARPLIGLPTEALRIGQDQYYVPGPNAAIHSAAEEYMRSKGLKYEPPQTYAKVDVQRAERIADEYSKMPHAPNDPKVKASYDAMIKETVDQFRALEKMGVKFEPIPAGAPDPYAASPRLANKDLRDNKHLWYFPTEGGFGSSAADVSNNPLLRMTDVVINGQRLPANDVFRIVHDVFGHFKEGVGFRAAGEENAWRSHSAMYSDLARPAMTSETRGQNSWVNYGPNGEKNRSASAADTTYADQKTGLLPDWVMNEGRNDLKPVEHDPFGFEDHPGYISTRLPTAVKAAEDPFNTRLTIDTDAMKQQPDLYKHNVGLVRRYPIMTSQEARLPVNQAADAFVNRVKDNILWLHDQVPPEIAARSKLWYDGANKIAHARADQYGVTPQQTSAVYAALSPQKDWFQNVSLGDRLMDTYFNHPDFKISKREMYDLPPLMQEPKFKPLRDAIEGRSLHELTDPMLKAFWIRAHDQLTRSPSHHLITPEGTYGGMVKTEAGAEAKMGWGSGVEIAKAINALESRGSVDAISRLMGERHKVRSFYNNILHPDAPYGDVTIDTHAVAGGLLQPLGGKAPEVAHNFGNYAGKDIPSARSSAITGTSGLYGLYADPYRMAAKERNLLPRQMQSITWEAGRGLFPEATKTAENLARVKSFWNSYRKGNMPIQDVRDAILENQGGMKPPPWWSAK